MDNISQFIGGNWPLLLPVVLGFWAVYALLPRVPRNELTRGAVFDRGVMGGTAALVFGGYLLIHQEFAAVEAVLFYSFSGLAILGGGLMLAQRNPVRAALSFALVVLSSCGLFLLLAAPFLMAATIVVYAGAIIITFLFVIMLAQQGGLTSADQFSREPFLASLAGFVLLACLLVVLHRNYETKKIDEVLAKIEKVAEAKSAEEIYAVLGKPVPDEWSDLPFIDKEVKPVFPQSVQDDLKLASLDFAWGALPDAKAKEELQQTFKKLLAEGHKLRRGQGTMMPGKIEIIKDGKREQVEMPLSPFSGDRADKPFPAERQELLKAGNVAQVGRSLFTDYLVAVELAGVLLLVATIGAIVIAGREKPLQKPLKN